MRPPKNRASDRLSLFCIRPPPESDIGMQSRTQSVAPPHNRWGLLLALSRTQHGVLDLATPVVAALLWAGGFPPLSVMSLGLITAFAGYTAVYAINDLVDAAHDRAKMAASDPADRPEYLDTGAVRHPLAQGMLSLRAALVWIGFWSLVAMVGAYALNPVCFYIFVIGACLEVVYCLLLKVTALRCLVSGMVKTAGGVAAVYAVDPNPSPWFLLALWAWVFSWEIGGQNIPADLYDVEQDQKLGARTTPVVLGLRRTTMLALACLVLTPLLSLAVLFTAPLKMHGLAAVAALAVGAYLLLLPVLAVWRSRAGDTAIVLFNRASYYPMAMLAVVLAGLSVQTLS